MDNVIIRNHCGWEKIDNPFLPLIEAARAGMNACCGDLLREIRLQGSIARGDARPGLADLDMIGLLHGSPSEDVHCCLEELAASLGVTTSLVSRFDLEAIDAVELQPFRRFVLSSDSLCVHGADTLTQQTQSMERVALARLVTSELAEIVSEYVEWADDLRSASESERRFACRIIAKDLLKVLRGVLLLRGASYEVAIPQIAGQTSDVAPEATDIADRLLSLYCEPITDVEHISDAARASAEFLNCSPEMSLLRGLPDLDRPSSETVMR